MSHRLFYLIFILSLLTTSTLSDPNDNLKKINEMNLLFPHISESLESRLIQYKLIAYNGCYEWSTSTQNSFQIQGIPDEINPRCHSSAIVSLLNSKPNHHAVWIIAKDKETGDVLKVEAKIAKIAKIDITTKSRTIDVGEMQTLEMVGYDQDGNMFSTLEGVKFEWTIANNNGVFELVSIKDSLKKATELRKKLEAQLIQTDIIVVKGLSPGNCQINSKLIEKDYFNIDQSSVRMHVMEHFTIIPEFEIFVLKKSSINFKLALIKREDSNSILKEIVLPNNNYHWSIDNETLGEVNSNGHLNTKNELGDLKMMVKDIKSDKKVEKIVHVVDFDQLELNIVQLEENKDFNNFAENFDNIWNLIVGKKYLVRAALYDDFHNPINITENLKFDFNFGDYKHEFDIIKTTHKDIVFIAKRKLDKFVFTGKLEHKSCEKFINVWSQIKIIKPDHNLHLPAITSDLEREIQSSFKLFVVGGSELYEWVSDDLDVAIVSQEGLIKSKRKGKTTIEVHDKFNLKNKEKIDIEVTNFQNLRSLEEMKEILVKDSDYLYVIAEDENHRTYSNCSSFQFDIHKVDEIVIETRIEYTSYWDLLNDLNYLSETYERIHELFKSITDKRKQLEISNYQTYITNGELKADSLYEIIKFYSNYGICSKVKIIANHPSEFTTKIVWPLNVNLQSAVIQIRFVERFKLTQPNVELMNSNEHEIILSYESSFEWMLEGGPNKWEETRNINEQYEVEDKTTGNIISNYFLTIRKLTKYYGQKINRHYYTSCNLPRGDPRNNHLYAIRLFSWNEADHKLLKPVNVSVIINVSCKIPSKLQIYTYNPYENPINVYDAKILGLEAVNLKNYADHYFQVFAYDNNLTPFYNFSSLLFTWKIKQPTSSVVISPIEYRDFEGICRICNDQFARLSVKECNEELILRAETEGLKAMFAKYPFQLLLWDEIALSILPNLQLNPQKAVLYYDLRNSIQIKISYGSGYFAVKTNDSDLLTFDYDRTNSLITVSPLKKGYAKIIVKDSKLEHSKTVNCDIIISEAFHMTLKTETNLLPIGDKTLIEVKVLDSNFELFPIEQYHLMKIYLQIDVDSEYLKSNALKISNFEDKNNVFLVEGLIVGSYKVKAIMTPNTFSSATGYISSNFVELHVFEHMRIQPDKMLIAPGCISTVELVGGPSEKSKVLNNVVLEAFLSPKNVVSFKELSTGLYEIYGINTGKVEVTFVLKYKDTDKEISAVNLEIKVALINNVQILGMIDRQLHIGSVVRLIAISKLEAEIFSHSVCNFEYTWKSTEPNVLHIPTPFQNYNSEKGNLNTENYLNLAVNASALSEGASEIILTVETKYEKKYESNTFTTSIKVNVIDPLGTEIPVNFNQQTTKPALLLIPPNSGYKLVTNKETSKLKFNHFSGQSDSEIQIDGVGYIKTTQYKGKYTFLIEDYGVEKQLMVVNVLVTNIYSIILENSYQILYLPTDSEIKLKIILQDNFGRHFPRNIDNMQFGLHITNPKAVELKALDFEQTLIIKAKSVGSSICFIYLEENPNVYDVFVINVGSMVTPSSPVYVHLGGFVFFTTNSKKVSNEYKWISEDPQILDINNNGRASALKEGKTNIRISDTIHHLTKVYVYKTTNILLNEAKSPYKITNILTNPHYKEEYQFYFRIISDEREVKFLNNLDQASTQPINNNLRFECETRNNELLQVKGEIIYDEIDNQQIPKCNVIMKHHIGSQRLSKSITIKASIISNTPNLFYLSQEFTVDLIPNFQIANKDYLIELNQNQNSKIIAIQSIDDLNYHANNEFINHNLNSKFDSANNIFLLNITLPENKIIKKTIESDIRIYNFLTNQSELIRVIYDPYSDKASGYSGKESSSFSILDAIIIVICLLVLVLMISQYSGKGTAGA